MGEQILERSLQQLPLAREITEQLANLDLTSRDGLWAACLKIYHIVSWQMREGGDMAELQKIVNAAYEIPAFESLFSSLTKLLGFLPFGHPTRLSLAILVVLLLTTFQDAFDLSILHAQGEEVPFCDVDYGLIEQLEDQAGIPGFRVPREHYDLFCEGVGMPFVDGRTRDMYVSAVDRWGPDIGFAGILELTRFEIDGVVKRGYKIYAFEIGPVAEQGEVGVPSQITVGMGPGLPIQIADAQWGGGQGVVVDTHLLEGGARGHGVSIRKLSSLSTMAMFTGDSTPIRYEDSLTGLARRIESTVNRLAEEMATASFEGCSVTIPIPGTTVLNYVTINLYGGEAGGIFICVQNIPEETSAMVPYLSTSGKEVRDAIIAIYGQEVWDDFLAHYGVFDEETDEIWLSGATSESGSDMDPRIAGDGIHSTFFFDSPAFSVGERENQNFPMILMLVPPSILALLGLRFGRNFARRKSQERTAKRDAVKMCVSELHNVIPIVLGREKISDIDALIKFEGGLRICAEILSHHFEEVVRDLWRGVKVLDDMLDPLRRIRSYHGQSPSQEGGTFRDFVVDYFGRNVDKDGIHQELERFVGDPRFKDFGSIIRLPSVRIAHEESPVIGFTVMVNFRGKQWNQDFTSAEDFCAFVFDIFSATNEPDAAERATKMRKDMVTLFKVIAKDTGDYKELEGINTFPGMQARASFQVVGEQPLIRYILQDAKRQKLFTLEMRIHFEESDKRIEVEILSPN